MRNVFLSLSCKIDFMKIKVQN